MIHDIGSYGAKYLQIVPENAHDVLMPDYSRPGEGGGVTHGWFGYACSFIKIRKRGAFWVRGEESRDRHLGLGTIWRKGVPNVYFSPALSIKGGLKYSFWFVGV